MLFSSVPFLFYFLPAALLIYFAAPRQLKNAVPNPYTTLLITASP